MMVSGRGSRGQHYPVTILLLGTILLSGSVLMVQARPHAHDQDDHQPAENPDSDTRLHDDITAKSSEVIGFGTLAAQKPAVKPFRHTNHGQVEHRQRSKTETDDNIAEDMEPETEKETERHSGKTAPKATDLKLKDPRRRDTPRSTHNKQLHHGTKRDTLTTNRRLGLERDVRGIEAKKGRVDDENVDPVFDIDEAAHKRKERIRNATHHLRPTTSLRSSPELADKYQQFLLFKRSMKSMDSELRLQIQRLKQLKKRRKAVILNRNDFGKRQ